LYAAEAATEAAQNGGGEGAQGTGGGGFLGSPQFLMLIAMFAIFYFLLIRPNTKREKERREMLSSLSKGDSVVTAGGIHGTIVGINEKSVVLRVSDDPPVKMEFQRSSVSRVTPQDSGNGE
jgi:preprotein translocase subunit YajC